jgi:hypothetical protein
LYPSHGIQRIAIPWPATFFILVWPVPVPVPVPTPVFEPSFHPHLAQKQRSAGGVLDALLPFYRPPIKWLNG